MSYMTRGQLKQYGAQEDLVRRVLTKKLEKVASVVTKAAFTSPTLFLSHSHQDQDLVSDALTFFADQNAEVYVDRLDDGMPATTSVETAQRLRHMIDASKKFVLLATPRSLQSRWVPWELGCADGLKGIKNVAVLAVEDHEGTFPNNEYVALYPTIHKRRDGKWGVLMPGEDGTTLLSAWLVE